MHGGQDRKPLDDDASLFCEYNKEAVEHLIRQGPRASGPSVHRPASGTIAAMHPDTREVAAHMRQFGMAVLGRAVYDLTFSEMMAPYKHSMSVGLAAQGAEICVKARIAQEHPLLLFTHLPKSANAEDQLTIKELFEYREDGAICGPT